MNKIKILSTSISQYLVYITNEDKVYKKKEIKQSIKSSRYKFFIWNKQELEHYSEENLHDVIYNAFNIHHNDDIVIHVNNVRYGKTNNWRETTTT